mmetsp:Transcript_60077/g.161057  ORF Transcript_60077/g.161057 Transcript_60077/m.161057 type:complete len:288 (+) Transcript_60077:1804-2667(+)
MRVARRVAGVQASQAEKNRQATQAAKLAQAAPMDIPVKVHVSGLVGPLEGISETEISKLFSPFGDIEFIDLQRNSATQKCTGSCYIQYKKPADAREAMQAMNGFSLAGQEIKVELVQATQLMGGLAPGLALPGMGGGLGGGLLALGGLGGFGAQAGLGGLVRPGMPNAGLAAGLPGVAAISATPLAPMAPTCNIRLVNMFDPKSPDIASDPDFFLDVKDDVAEECAKHGPVDKVWVDAKSTTGQVWVKFKTVVSAQAARSVLSGRWFAGQQIQAEFVTDADWNSTVP